MNHVRPKKHLGQHFLTDENIAKNITDALFSGIENSPLPVLEIGPGTGVLTKYLIHHTGKLFIIDIDEESIVYLKEKFKSLEGKIIHADFLQMNFKEYFDDDFLIIGNFPYNISSQILFKVLENKHQVSRIVGMFQKEVAERIASKPGKKTYGILSVLMQAFYDTELLFTVDEQKFNPPPQVQSAVIRFTRKENIQLECNEKMFFKVVKTAFNQRRKMLRNGLSEFIQHKDKEQVPFLDKRAETLSWQDFVVLTKSLEI